MNEMNGQWYAELWCNNKNNRITEFRDSHLAPIAVEMVHRGFYPRPIGEAISWPSSWSSDCWPHSPFSTHNIHRAMRCNDLQIHAVEAAIYFDDVINAHADRVLNSCGNSLRTVNVHPSIDATNWKTMQMKENRENDVVISKTKDRQVHSWKIWVSPKLNFDSWRQNHKNFSAAATSPPASRPPRSLIDFFRPQNWISERLHSS